MPPQVKPRVVVSPVLMPPMSIGGGEDVGITLAMRHDALLYCTRPRNFNAAYTVSPVQTYLNIFEERGIEAWRTFYGCAEDEARLKKEPIKGVCVVCLGDPRLIIRALDNVLPTRVPLMFIPFYHVIGGSGSAHLGLQMFLKGLKHRSLSLATCSVGEQAPIVRLMGRPIKSVIAPHMAGMCVPFGIEKPAATYADLIDCRITQARYDKGYVLFPSRPSKDIETARSIANNLGLPLIGNPIYHVGDLVDAKINFDQFDPYKGARILVNLGIHDSYSIGVAKAMARGVPAIWNDENTQIVPIWSEFKSAIPLSQFLGSRSLAHAERYVKEASLLIQQRIRESLVTLDSFWHNTFGAK